MDISLIAGLLAMGAVVGFAAGLLGIGGGMMLVPFLTMMFDAKGFAHEYVVHMAIATALATIVFTSLSSVRAHHARGAVQWRVVGLLVPGILVGSWVGPWIGAQMNASALALAFALFVGFSATQMLLGRKPAAARELPGSAGMFAAGGVIGVLSGLFGAGGGFISVPFLTWCNVKIQHAVATSAALGFPIALAGTLSNIYYGMHAGRLPSGALGFVYLPALLVIVLASVATAPLGARTAHSLPVQSLKKVFALVLYLLGGYMLVKSFR